jgi:hypothetical protein
LPRGFGTATSADVSLPEREWNCADGQEQKQIKRASNKMRFDRGADVRVHLDSASVRKHLLLEARQGSRDFSPLDSNETKMSDGGRDRALLGVGV